MKNTQKIDSGKTIQEKATVFRDVANSLSGLYKPHEYGLVILPMSVVKPKSTATAWSPSTSTHWRARRRK